MVLEIIIVILSLGMELSTVFKPTLDYSKRCTGISLTMFMISVGYMIYSVMWAISGEGTVKTCGIIICLLSVISFTRYLVVRKKSLVFSRIDSSICSATLAAVLLSRFGLIS